MGHNAVVFSLSPHPLYGHTFWYKLRGMKNRRLTADEIAAIIFDPIPQQKPRKTVLGILCGEPPQAEPATAPAYRSLAAAKIELQQKGVHPAMINYLSNGLSDLLFEVVVTLEQEHAGTFSRRTSVKWNDDTAYLGIRFNHPEVNEIVAQKPILVSAIRRKFVTAVEDIIGKRARTSLPSEAYSGLQPLMA